MADNVLSKLIAAYVETNPDSIDQPGLDALRERAGSGNRLSSADRRLIEEMSLALVRAEYPKADVWLRRVQRRFGGERRADYKTLRPYFSSNRQPEALFETDLLRSLRKADTNRSRFENLTELYRLYYTYFHQGERANKPRHPNSEEAALLEKIQMHLRELEPSLGIRTITLDKLNEIKQRGGAAESLPLIDYNAKTGGLFLESPGAIILEGDNRFIHQVGASWVGDHSLFFVRDPQTDKTFVARVDASSEEEFDKLFFDDLRPALFRVFDEEALARIQSFVVFSYKNAPIFQGRIGTGFIRQGFDVDVLSDPFVPFMMNLNNGERLIGKNFIEGHTADEPIIFHGIPEHRQLLTTFRDAVKVVSHYVDSLNYRGLHDYWESLQAFFPHPESLLARIRNARRRKDGPVRVGDAGAGFAVFLRQLKQIFGDRVRTTGVDLVDWSNPHLGIYKSDDGFERYIQTVKFLGSDLLSPQFAPDHFLEENLETAQFPEPVDLLFASYTIKYVDDPLRGLVNLYNQLSVGGELYVTRPPHPHAVARIGNYSVDVIELFTQQLKKAGIDAVLKKDGLMVRRKDDRAMRILVSADAAPLMQQEFQYVGYSQITSANTSIFELVENGRSHDVGVLRTPPANGHTSQAGSSKDLMAALRETEIQYPETEAVDFLRNRKTKVNRVYERLLVESSGRPWVPLEDKEFMSLRPSERIQLYVKLSAVFKADAEDSRWQAAARALMILINDLPRDDRFVLLAYVHDIVTGPDFAVRPEASNVVKMIKTEHARSAIDYFFYKAGTQIEGRKIAVSLDSIVMDSLGEGVLKEVRLRLGMVAFLDGLAENNRLFLYSSLNTDDMVTLLERFPRLKGVFTGIRTSKPIRPRSVSTRRRLFALQHQTAALDRFLTRVEVNYDQLTGDEEVLWDYLSRHPQSAIHLKHPLLTRSSRLDFDTIIDTDPDSIVLLETDGITNVDVFPLQRNLVPTGQVWDLYNSLAAGFPDGYRYSFSDRTRGHESYPLETAKIRFVGEDQLGRRRTAQQFARRIRKLRADIEERRQLSLPFENAQTSDGSPSPQGGGGRGRITMVEAVRRAIRPRNRDVRRSRGHQVRRKPSLVARLPDEALAKAGRSPALSGVEGSLVGAQFIAPKPTGAVPKQSLGQVFARLFFAGEGDLREELRAIEQELTVQQKRDLIAAGRNGIGLVAVAERIVSELDSKLTSRQVDKSTSQVVGPAGAVNTARPIVPVPGR